MILLANDGKPQLLCASASPTIFMNPITGTEGFVEVVAIDTDGTKYRVVLNRAEIRRIVTCSLDLAPEGSVWKSVTEFHAEHNRNKIRNAPSPV